MIPTSQDPPWKQQHQRQFKLGMYNRFKYIEIKLVLEREKDGVSPFWWQKYGGVYKSSFISQSKWKPPHNYIKMIDQFTPTPCCFLHRTPTLWVCDSFFFSPCMTSVRQDMAFHMFLQVWGLSQAGGEVLFAWTDPLNHVHKLSYCTYNFTW